MRSCPFGFWMFTVVVQKTLLDGWKDGWMDGWVGGGKSRVKDCLQQSKIKKCSKMEQIYSNIFIVVKLFKQLVAPEIGIFL